MEAEEELAFCGKCEKRGVVFAALFYADDQAPMGLGHQHFAVCTECGDERDMACPEGDEDDARL